MMDSLSLSRSWSRAAAGGGRGRVLQRGTSPAEGGPSCFADEKTVAGVLCLAKARPGSQDRGQAICLELGALDHAS